MTVASSPVWHECGTSSGETSWLQSYRCDYRLTGGLHEIAIALSDRMQSVIARLGRL
jgi:hypothetical protein